MKRPDILLTLSILGFMALVVVNTFSRVAQVWPYLILFELHYHLARYSLALALVMAAIAVYVGIARKGDVTPLFRRATYVIVGTMVLESLIGAGMYFGFGTRPGQEVHLIYGMGTMLSLPFFIFVEKTAKKRPAMGSYIWGFTLLAGIILRSITTGAG